MNNLILTLIELFLHLDKHLATVIQAYGVITFVFLFLIIFCETGLVVTPFLPGDSLIFAAGALAASGSLNVGILAVVVTIAAILGDTVNYWIGYFFGSKIVERDHFLFLKKEHIDKTHQFYAKYGGKTIIFARFVPIVRTVAPFIAGVGKMHYGNFISFNIVGGIAWVLLFVFAGYFFGNLPLVKHNFSLVIIAVILVSLVPGIIEYLKSRKTKPATENSI